MVVEIITALLILLAGASNAMMDLSSERVFKIWWWNKDEGWKNKWKHGDPDQGPAFFGSTTIFAWTTDGWHLFQMIFHTCWQLAIAIQYDNWIVKFIIIKVMFSIFFEYIYSRIKNKKK